MINYGDSIFTAFKQLVEALGRISHTYGSYYADDEEVFIFFSANKTHSKKVHDLLKKHNLLCSTDLGKFKI